jgi:hypothetical protein
MSLTWLSFKPDRPAEEKTMASSFYKSWWREMGAISRGMMFIEGNLTDPASQDRTASATGQAGETEARPLAISTALRKQASRAYRNFLLLGGRPVSPGHNDDIDEPFPPIDEDESAPQHLDYVVRSAPSQYGKTSQPQTCATC